MKTIKEARESLKSKYAVKMSRKEVCEALSISLSTLYRLNIDKTVSVENGHKSVKFNRDDVAILLFKRSK